MKDVREIPEFRRMPSQSRRAALPRKRPVEPDDVLAELAAIVCGSRQIALADTQEYVEWINPRYSRELIRELHHGRFARQDTIDLHGMIREEAARVLAEFLANARRSGHRCVKIVHGRGLGSPNGPVIKQSVVAALSGRFRKQVIGFVTARQNDGGLGALYVLLV